MEDSMPSVDELGTEYTSFPIHFGEDDGGYESQNYCSREQH